MKHIRYFTALLAGILLLFSAAGQVSAIDKALSISYEKYTLPNGLQVILHQDHSDPIVATAIMYHVGSNREEKGKTGFAHLFEHMLFQRSENVPEDQYFKYIQNVGGTLNGFTSNDMTTYFEIVPKNALELILWMESDRMGYFINTLTQDSFSNQQNVVQNEKRQRVDNVPYGHTNFLIDKFLYGEGHPYFWQVIGEMPDLQNATVEDVKTFYQKYYGPNNATLVVAGDFEKDATKKLIEQYFGEIKSHGEVPKLTPQKAQLKETKRLSHEDNFANVPELTMTWATPENFNQDSYALDYLSNILTQGKKAPLYKVLVKEQKLSSEVNSYNYTRELAGRFTLSIRANEGYSIDEMEQGVQKALLLFEKEGITQNDIDRIKAMLETSFYGNISSIFPKALQLASYNTFTGDPGYLTKDIEKILSVTIADVQRVYNTYIKGKPYVLTSFVPKGKTSLNAKNTVLAEIVEENTSAVNQQPQKKSDPQEFVKTASKIDRSKEPALGTDPSIKLPEIWESELENGLTIYGIENNELPLVTFQLAIDGGSYLDDPKKPGVANLLTDMLMEGTQTKTPEQLEEAIELLGSSISWYTTREEIVVQASCLARNFAKTVALVEEMLLKPRWDTEQFELARTRNINEIEQLEANPEFLASRAMYKILYGNNHIFANHRLGTKQSLATITLQDLKTFYETNFSPSIARFNLAGKVSKKEVLNALSGLSQVWKAKKVTFPTYTLPPTPEHSALYFIDVPKAKQSVVYAGMISVPRSHPDYFDLTVLNHKLGGSFNSFLNMILREEKGYTYGASSNFGEMKNPAPFLIQTNVRSDATLDTVQIYHNTLTEYINNIHQEDLNFTRNALIKSNCRRFETIGAQLSMLSTINKYLLPKDYIRKEENAVRTMTVDRLKQLAKQYIKPGHMIYIVAGDAASQLEPLKKLGLGEPILLK